MYSVIVADENYNQLIYNLTLTTSDIRKLYQLGVNIDTFFHNISLEGLCLFFTVCLQSSNLSDGERFIDDYLNEHSQEELIGIIPPFFAEVIGIDKQDKEEVSDTHNVPSDVNNEPVSIIKILDDYLLGCLQLGLTEAEFNRMTLAEVKRWIDAHEKCRIRELKEQAMISYISVDLIGVSVGRLLTKDVSYPQFTEAFASLFTEEEIKQIEEERLRARREETIARMKAMAKAHNDRLENK